MTWHCCALRRAVTRTPLLPCTRHAGSRYADLGGAVAAPAGLAAIALAWYAPVISRFLAQPPATPHGATIAWYVIASAALAVTCVAMRDQWHRYSRPALRGFALRRPQSAAR